MRERALLITPVRPDPSGTGPAQRAFQWARHLGARYMVDTIVVHRRQPHDPSPPATIDAAGSWREFIATPTRGDYWRQAARAACAAALGRRRFAFTGSGREWAFVTPAIRAELAQEFRAMRWARAVAFRVQVYDYADMLVQLGALVPDAVTVDFDDVESTTRRSIAAGLKRSGRWREALIAAVDARYTARVERRVTDVFPNIAIASPADRSWVEDNLPRARVSVFPNRIRELPAARPPGDPHCILFLATLGYFPNQEAVVFLVEDVLPALHRNDPRWRVVVAGYDAPGWLVRRLRGRAGVDYRGAVASVAEAYGAAGMVAAPLFSGGGTKIKVLEALGHGRALVATGHAVRGLSLRPSVDYWEAETPIEWVAACQRIAREPSLAQQLGASGRAAVRDNYLPRQPADVSAPA